MPEASAASEVNEVEIKSVYNLVLPAGVSLGLDFEQRGKGASDRSALLCRLDQDETGLDSNKVEECKRCLGMIVLKAAPSLQNV